MKRFLTCAAILALFGPLAGRAGAAEQTLFLLDHLWQARPLLCGRR